MRPDGEGGESDLALGENLQNLLTHRLPALEQRLVINDEKHLGILFDWRSREDSNFRPSV